MISNRKFCSVQLTIIFIWLFMLFTPAESVAAAVIAPGENPVSKLVARQLLVVLDPRANPARAADIARGDPNSVVVQDALAAFQGAIHITKVVAGTVVVDIDALRRENPLAPEVLLSEYLVLTFPEDFDIEAQRARLERHPLVLSVERNQLLQLSAAYLDQGTASSIGTYEWGLTAASPLNFPAAWAKIRGSAYIAALDNGITWQGGATHADLTKNFRPQFSRHPIKATTIPNQAPSFVFVPFDSNFDEPLGNRGHGTHVAGLIAGSPAAAIGMTGACPSCSLFVHKLNFADLPEPPAEFTSNDVTAASLVEAMNTGAQVVNMSFGDTALDSGLPGSDGPRPPNYCQQYPTKLLCVALASAHNRGISLVAASGNRKNGLDFPANQLGVLAVGGLEKHPTNGIQFWTTGYVGSPSNVCPVTTSGVEIRGIDGDGSNCSGTADLMNNQFQLVAPAKDVLSTFYQGSTYNPLFRCGDQWDPEDPASQYWSHYLTQSGYGDCTGTSMSAPIVSGIVGLIRSANPLLTDLDAAAVIRRRATGAGSVIDRWMGYGIPNAGDSVIAAMSGANAVNPSVFNPAVINRLTPLFSLYSASARNHLFSSVPQMGAAAINGTIKPSPRYQITPTSVAVSCTPPCAGNSINVIPAIRVLNPDGTSATANVGVHIIGSGGQAFPQDTYNFSDASGFVGTNMTWYSGPPVPNSFADTLQMTPVTDYVLPYTSVGSLVPGYGQFPSIYTLYVYPRSSVSVYVSHVNPLGTGPDLTPIYRLSWRCGDSAKVICDNPGAPGYNPFHISHLYAAGDTEKANALATGYKLDGIEGYVFPKSYGSAPQSGMVRLCRLYDSTRDEEILFPGTGGSGNKCYPPFPSYTVGAAGGSYYSSTIYSTDWMGWVYANYNGATPPTVNLTSPVNNATFSAGSNISLTATASGSGVNNVKWYANGIQIASDNTSPYSKTWSSVPAGTYTVYAVANTGSELSATSAPANITVGSAPPVLGNNGFETPSVGSGPSAYVYGPTGASWIFTPAGGSGGSGVSGNGSNFTIGNLNAPYGQQVGFIQGATTISQTVNFAGAGSYHLTTYAAQRSSNQNGIAMTVNVLVDGISAGAMTPYDPYYQYQLNSSSAFSVTAGSHTITLQGVNPNGYDLTVFFDNVLITSP
ncbi:MAG: S8 family serine peptidase [Betaproteobacteria bacterium]